MAILDFIRFSLGNLAIAAIADTSVYDNVPTQRDNVRWAIEEAQADFDDESVEESQVIGILHFVQDDRT